MQDITVTVFQSDLIWQDVGKNLANFSKKLDALKEKSDLIILPEMFNTGFVTEPKDVAEKSKGITFLWMKEQAKKHECVITGSFIAKEKNNYYNRLVWMQPNGFFLTYDKQHLFRMGGEHNHFTAGTEQLTVNLKGWKIRPLICYDLRFPVWSKNRYYDGNYEYDLLIYVANWPQSRAHAWKTLLTARAIENQAYAIGVNRIGSDGNNLPYSGDSQIINAKGFPIAAIQENKEDYVTKTLSYKDLTEFREKFNVGPDWNKFEFL